MSDEKKTRNIRIFKAAITWVLTFLIPAFGLAIFDIDLGKLISDIIDNELLKWSLISAITSVFGSLIFAISRRVKPSKPPNGFFSQTALLKLPENKQRYSDRMAYLLAELSDLAYYEVENYEGHLVSFANAAKEIADENGKATIDKVVSLYRQSARSTGTSDDSIQSMDHLDKVLDQAGFSLYAPYLNSGSAQGFISVYRDDQKPASDGRPNPFIVIAFRGSEKKIEDWLTNVSASPSKEVKDGKVHKGFYEDFWGVKPQIESILEEISEEYRKELPVFITGHSLGGAVATIATRELFPDRLGACYTYGAPRVGDYDYFSSVKTPVYRIVNSSDIVPRVPPGMFTHVFILFLAALRYVLARFPTAVQAIYAAEGWVNKIKDYRHFGDQRYLTDVASDKIETVQLLRNPNYLDVFQWFWRHIFVSYGMPVKSHSMSLYRRKLAQVALDRLS